METEARALLEGEEHAELHDVLRIAPEILGPGLRRRLMANPEQKLEMAFNKTTISAALNRRRHGADHHPGQEAPAPAKMTDHSERPFPNTTG